MCRGTSQTVADWSVAALERKPKYLSTDHDPLFRFHRWLANLRVIEVEEIKSVRNHSFAFFRLRRRPGVRWGLQCLRSKSLNSDGNAMSTRVGAFADRAQR
jgi:hypothetical protein